MKKNCSSLLLITMLIALMQLVACTASKDPAPAVNCRLTQLKKGGDTLDRIYEYDVQGRISKVITYDRYNQPATTTVYAYTPTSISYEVSDVRGLLLKYSATIGANGYISGSISATNQYFKQYDTTSYEYNAEGYLIKEVNRHGYDSRKGILEITTSKYTYNKHGNRALCDQVLTITNPDLNRTRAYWQWIDYEYDESRMNHLKEPVTELLGKASRNVLIKEVWTDLSPYHPRSSVVQEYSHEFDELGYIRSRTVKNSHTSQGKTTSRGTYTYNFVYQCR